MTLHLGRRLSGLLATVSLALALLAGARIASAVHGHFKRAEPAPALTSPPLGRFAEGDLIARVYLPRLRARFEVYEGVETATLARGGGHVPGTALPGESGGERHCLIALPRGPGAPLADLRLSDRIEMKTPFGLRRYSVVSRSILPRGAASVGDARPGHVTLVTPYPPDAIGPAPSRLAIVGEAEDRDANRDRAGDPPRGLSFLRGSREWLAGRSTAALRPAQLFDELRNAIDRSDL